MAILNFNARTVDPSSGFDPLPAGWYNARIVESEIKPTNAGDGAMLAVQYEIIDGQYSNRRVFQNFNIENKNPVAVKIAYEQLSALSYCCGVLDVQDSTMLHGIPLQIKLVEKPAGSNPQTGKTWDAGNEVKDYRNAAGQSAKEIIAGGSVGGATAPAAPGAPAAPSAPAAPAAPSAPAAPAAHDPMAAAVADGWVKHPTSEGYHYKGQEVKTDAEVAAMYPAPAATAPAAPAAPAAPSAPAAPAAPPAAPAAGGAATPPWAAPKA